ncbi:Transcription factor MYB44 [Dichanthelium oligosanthes]|uniref:Transcription factor MYB44 n=1 Tax=Dichanthelium oligosanthes TaxID=888268 RepID=A0A1E5V389_9POAL|nr:Transcription factor MYB44 [Dichanthelium oligosanthes]
MAAECGEAGKADCKKTPWTAEEDEALRRAVREHGRQNWAAIAGDVAGGRGAKSCRLRWCQHLAPELDSRPFTPEEDARIVEQQRVHGNKWATIARYLHGRSDNAVKNRWNSALRKMQPQGNPVAAAAAAAAPQEEEADDATEDQAAAAAAPACLDLFPLRAGEMREQAAAADRFGVRDEEEEGDDVASIGLTLGSPGLSEAELALSLRPVRPSSDRGDAASFRLCL